MVKKIVLSFLTVACAAVSALSADCYYLINGSGTWADSTRWKKGQVPQEGDVVVIAGGAAHVTADDTATLSLAHAISLVDAESSIVFDLETEFHYNKRFIGKGKIVQNGTGALYLDIDSYSLLKTEGGIEVTNGEIHLSEDSNKTGHVYEYGPIKVNAPGKVFFNKNLSSSTPGLSGDGIITNVATEGVELQLIPNFEGYEGLQHKFSGTISPNVELTFAGVTYQDFLADQNANLTTRPHSGRVGLKHFGEANKPGSLGTGVIWLRGSATHDPIRFVYIGDEDEACTKIFRTTGNPQGAIIDGGARGGLTLTGGLEMTSRTKTTVEGLWLDGSNTEHRCTLNTTLDESATDLAVHTFLTKCGIGTWRIVNTTGFNLRGGVAIERGILEADVLNEQGKRSSIGYGLIRQSRYFGVPDATKDVSWALLLGNGSMPADEYSGTLAYVGASAVAVTNRPVALNGAGRLRNDTGASFSWTGVTSENSGNHALVLGGIGTENVVRAVTNGVGKITVVKEGTGMWTLDGEHDVAALVAKGGTLNVKANTNYRFYRLNVKEVWGATDVAVMITRLALFDADGTCRNLGLAENTSAHGKPATLQPSQWAFTTSDFSMTRSVSHLFVENTMDADNDLCTFFFHPKSSVYPSLTDEESWLRIVMRVAEDAPALTRYDLCASTQNPKDGVPYGREPKSWTFEGSLDGVNWTELHSVVSNSTPITAKYQWYSTRSATYEAGVTGYAVAAKPQVAPLKTTAVDSVQVSGDATIVSDVGITASVLRYDGNLGGGTLDGFIFPASGTIEAANVDFANGGVLDVTFTNCAGVENFANWQVRLNGRIWKGKVEITPAGKIRLVRTGFLLLYR